MSDRRLVMPLPKDTFKSDSTYQDEDGAITFRNSIGNTIVAMLSGTYQARPYAGSESREELEKRKAGYNISSAVGPVAVPPDPTATDLDILTIAGEINGHKVAVAYIDGFDLEKGQPKTGEVKQGDNIAIGDAGEYLKVKIAVDGKFVTPQEAASLVGLSYLEDEKSALATGSAPDDITTPSVDESKAQPSGDIVGLGLKAGALYLAYKLFF